MNLIDLVQALNAPESCAIAVAKQSTPRLMKLVMILDRMDMSMCQTIVITDPEMKGNTAEDMFKCVKLCEEAVTVELAKRGVIAIKV